MSLAIYIGMLMHRIKTLGHIVATTNIPWFKALGNVVATTKKILLCKGLGIGTESQDSTDAWLEKIEKNGSAILVEWQKKYKVLTNYIDKDTLILLN